MSAQEITKLAVCDFLLSRGWVFDKDDPFYPWSHPKKQVHRTERAALDEELIAVFSRTDNR